MQNDFVYLNSTDVPAGRRRQPRILLIDDDPVFGKIMQRVAECAKVRLTFVATAEQLGSVDPSSFDVGILDYDLGSVTGVDVVRDFDRHKQLPIVLVSQAVRSPESDWPGSIRQFICKDKGPHKIIVAAVEALQVAHRHRSCRSLRRRASHPAT